MTLYAVLAFLCLVLWRLEKVAVFVSARRDAEQTRQYLLDQRKVAIEELRRVDYANIESIKANHAYGMEERRLLLEDRRLAEAEKREREKVERETRMAERKITLEEKRFAPKVSELELPPEVEAHALMQSEEWAQNDVRKVAREMFAEIGDWPRVIARLSEMS